MDSPTRTLVRRALDELKPYLATYVIQALAGTRNGRPPERGDMSALLGAMVQNWESVFARKLSPTVRHYVFELRDIRNRWAHEEPFDEDEAERAAHTARMVAKAIDAPKSVLDALGSLGRPAMTPQIAQPSSTRAPAQPSRPIGANDAAAPLDLRGVIEHTVNLSAADVSMQRVLCPACKEKIFETWPGGWDAHAAHACRGLEPGTEAARKATYRARFAHLFRDGGRAARPGTQRDVMRRLYDLHGADEDLLIREYAAAERRGEVSRKRNANGVTPEDYARALLNDARIKGWLPGF